MNRVLGDEWNIPEYRTTNGEWNIPAYQTAAFLIECNTAASIPAVFSVFRSLPYTMAVMETAAIEDVPIYLAVVESAAGLSERLLAEAVRNDEVGGPRQLHTVAINGKDTAISGTSARHASVCASLYDLFGNLDGMDIVEIGGGYGGLCRIIHGMWPGIRSYTIYDRLEVSRLQQKYLKSFGLSDVSFCSGPIRHASIDLTLASHSLSELNVEAQTVYADRILSRSQRGYIVWNGPGSGDASTDWVSADSALDHLKRLCPKLDIRIRPTPEQFFNVVTGCVEERPNVKTLVW